MRPVVAATGASRVAERIDGMRTVIEGGWVVAWNGRSHEVHEQGSVVFEGERIVHAGGPYPGAADTRIAARGKLVSPGFINTHVHTAGNGGDYLLLDMARNDYRTSNYMAFAAPLKGKMTPPPPEATAAIRAFVLLHALRNGTTTVIDVGGLRGDWDGYARLVDDLGVRVYGGPPFRDRDTYMDAQGRLTYEEDTAVGRERLKEAVDFARKFDGAAGGRLRALFNAAQVETCSEPLLRAGKEAAAEMSAPIHTHAGGNLIEFQRIMDEYRKTPVRFLADIGFLDERTLLGHVVFTTAHEWTRYPFGDDLRLLVDHRERLVRHRVELNSTLLWHLHDLWPELEIPARVLTAGCWQERIAGRLARAEQTARVRIARDELRRIRELTRSIDALQRELAALVAELAPQLLAEPGCGVLTAAKLIGEIADQAIEHGRHQRPFLLGQALQIVEEKIAPDGLEPSPARATRGRARIGTRSAPRCSN